MATELGVGYVSIIPSTRGFAKALSSQITAPVASAGAKSGESFTSRFLGASADVGKGIVRTVASATTSIASGVVSTVAGVTTRVGGFLASVAKWGAIGAVGITAMFAGSALKNGYERLGTIDSATKSLTISLGSSAKASELLGDTLNVVKGTPFPLDQFADAAQNLSSMGIEAKKIPGYLTAIADVSSTKGKQAAQYASQLTNVFGQVKAQNRIMGSDLLQFSGAGVNALAILGNHFGVTSEEMSGMVSKGLVPASEALDVLAKGIEQGSNGVAGFTPKLAGMAKELATTVPGAVMNFKASLSRGGAALVAPAYAQAPKFLAALGNSFETVGNAAGAVVRAFMATAGGQKFMKNALTAITVAGPKAAGWLTKVAANTGILVKRVANSKIVTTVFDYLKGISLSGVVANLKDFGDKAKTLFDQVKNSKPIQDLIDKLSGLKNVKGGDVLSKIGDVLQDRVLPALKKLSPSAGNLVTFISNLKKAAGTSGKGILFGAVASLPAFVTLVNLTTTLVAKVPPNVLVALFGAFATFKVAKGAADGVNNITKAIGGAKDALGAFGSARTNITKLGSTLKGLPTSSLTKLKSGFETVGLKAMYAKDKVANGAKAVADFGRKSATAALGMAKTVAQFVAQKAAMIATKTAELALTAARKAAVAVQWLLNAAMNANPITLIVVGIAALAAGFVLAYTKVGWFHNAVDAVGRFFRDTLWPILKTVGSFIGQVFVGYVKQLWNAFLVARTVIQNAVNAIVGFVVGIAGRIAGPVSTIWNGLRDGITAARDWVRARIDDVVGFVAGIQRRVRGVLSGVAEVIAAPFKAAGRIIKDLWNDTVGGFGVSIPDIPGLPGRGKRFEIPEMHGGGVVPGGASNEPIYKLQGGEVVLSRAQVKALGQTGKSSKQVAQHNTFNVYDQVDLDLANSKLMWQLTRTAF